MSPHHQLYVITFLKFFNFSSHFLSSATLCNIVSLECYNKLSQCEIPEATVSELCQGSLPSQGQQDHTPWRLLRRKLPSHRKLWGSPSLEVRLPHSSLHLRLTGVSSQHDTSHQVLDLPHTQDDITNCKVPVSREVHLGGGNPSASISPLLFSCSLSISAL